MRSGPTPGFGAIWAHIGRLAGCRIAGARRQWPQHRRTTEAGRWQERTLASKELIPAAPVAPPPVGVIGLLAQLLAAPLPLHTPLILFSTVCNTLGLLGRQMSDRSGEMLEIPNSKKILNPIIYSLCLERQCLF